MSTILIDQDGYKLVSYGNGAAYSLERRDPDGVAIVAVQGEDADQLRDEIQAFESAWPCASRAALARFLWTTLDYGAAASPRETA